MCMYGATKSGGQCHSTLNSGGAYAPPAPPPLKKFVLHNNYYSVTTLTTMHIRLYGYSRVKYAHNIGGRMLNQHEKGGGLIIRHGHILHVWYIYKQL